jgi:hypothetical protein
MASPDPDPVRSLLDDLRVWALDFPAHDSPRYGAICDGLADDPARANLLLDARPGFQNPLILLAAVHHLLLGGERHPLASYYATVVGGVAREVDDGLYPAFAAFVDAHRPRLADLVSTRTTQTNEARRTVVTLPALGLVSRAAEAPLALLEVGASAGLNLLVDRYGFRIGEIAAGPEDAAVRVSCAVEGEVGPPVPRSLKVGWRLGLDLNPLDVRDPQTRDWLRALVWPEHPDRLELLDAALEVARRDPPLVLRGDLVDDLAPLAAQAPMGTALTVITTWTLAYLEPERRRAFIARLGEIAAARGEPVWLIAGEAQSVLASLEIGLAEMPPEGFGPSTLSLHRFHADGGREHRLLAHAHPHGRWIRWLDAATGEPAA